MSEIRPCSRGAADPSGGGADFVDSAFQRAGLPASGHIVSFRHHGLKEAGSGRLRVKRPAFRVFGSVHHDSKS